MRKDLISFLSFQKRIYRTRTGQPRFFSMWIYARVYFIPPRLGSHRHPERITYPSQTRTRIQNAKICLAVDVEKIRNIFLPLPLEDPGEETISIGPNLLPQLKSLHAFLPPLCH
ncbi:hypothetical protein ABKN59_011883 [Abortiporus biennis]